MSNSPSRRASNVAFAGEAKAKKNLVKLDLSQLEEVIQDLYTQNQFLKSKIEHLETEFIRDEALEQFKRKLEELSLKEKDTGITISNIQTKIVEIEANFLKMDNRAKSYEMEIKVAKNTEKDTKAALKREIKLINTKMFEAEKRFPEITQQFTRPLEEKTSLSLLSFRWNRAAGWRCWR